VTKSEPRHQPLVETSGPGKRYGSITAVQDLNISFRRCEVYGFLGPNDSGKTTTLRMLPGLVKPSSGTAKVLGEEWARWSNPRRSTPTSTVILCGCVRSSGW
jgi:ABC-2 type transport system ATP-binding protein